jgi:hypothetical protein
MGQDLGSGFRVRIQGQDSGSGFKVKSWVGIQSQKLRYGFRVRFKG